jgi:6-phosphogluconolactonase
MARDALLRHVPVPAAQVHRFHGEWPSADEAAEAYSREIDAAFAAARRADRSFDLMLLGIGEDAHIASIFPESPLLEAPRNGNAPVRLDTAAGARRAAAVWAPHLRAWRLSLTPATRLESRSILVLASGERKRAAIRAALYGPVEVTRWPAQLLRRAADRVEWMIDRAADPRGDGPATMTRASG